jgi:hypothetical protein
MLHPHVTPLCYTSMPARCASKTASPRSTERRRPVGLDAVYQNKRAGFPAQTSPRTKDNPVANRDRRRSVVDVLRV